MIYYMNIFNAMAANRNQYAVQDLNVYHVMTLIFVKLVLTQDYFRLIKLLVLLLRIQIHQTEIFSPLSMKILILKIKFNLIKK
jgi:hypothetical protein